MLVGMIVLLHVACDLQPVLRLCKLPLALGGPGYTSFCASTVTCTALALHPNARSLNARNAIF